MKTKVCGDCKIRKSVSQFYSYKDTRNKNGIKKYLKHCCKKCDRIRGDIQKDRSRKRKRLFMWEYKKSHPCIDCGERNPFVLQFDHTRDKIEGVADMCNGSQSIKKLQQEIEKCEVRCAKCHLIKTAREQNWYLYELSLEGFNSIDEYLESLRNTDDKYA